MVVHELDVSAVIRALLESNIGPIKRDEDDDASRRRKDWSCC